MSATSPASVNHRATHVDQPVLRVAGLKKSYGETVAVHDVSIEVKAGEIVGLLGPNGAGKTTTINCVVGLLDPDRANIDLPSSNGDIRDVLGLATQEIALYPDLSVATNLSFFARLNGLEGETLTRSVDEVMSMFQLTEMARKRVRDLSVGQKRLTHVATALVHHPLLVVLDEPTAGLDVTAREHVLQAVRSAADSGAAVLYSSHYLQEVEDLCDRVVIIDRGRVIASGSVSSLIEAHGDPRVEITVSGQRVSVPGFDIASAIASVRDRGTIEAVDIVRPSLEAVFLQLTGNEFSSATDSE